MGYSSIAWLPLATGLTTIGVIAGSYACWRRGLRPALVGVAWSLPPIEACYEGAGHHPVGGG